MGVRTMEQGTNEVKLISGYTYDQVRELYGVPGFSDEELLVYVQRQAEEMAIKRYGSLEAAVAYLESVDEAIREMDEEIEESEAHMRSVW